VQDKEQSNLEGGARFFSISMMHDNLGNMLETHFQMMQHHHYSLTDIENMLPWEKQIYVGMISEYVKKHNEEVKELEAKMPKR